MRYLNSADYAIIAAYCLILIAIAVYLKRMASRSLEDYFLGGKQLPWYVLGVSGMLNFVDMTGTMVIVSFLYMMGPRGLYIEFRGGACLVLAFMLLWTGKWHYRSQCMTAAEWNIYRFGSTAGAKVARLLGVVFGTAFTVAMLAYLIKGAGAFLSMFLDFRPEVCAAMMVALTTLYTLMSGFYGVAFTDLFQSGIILISVIAITLLAMSRIAGYEGDLGLLAAQVSGNAQWMSSVPHVRTAMPRGYEDFEPVLILAGGYLFRQVLGGMGTGADPRYFGARNERECGLLTYFWTWLMTFRWPLMMGFAVLGIFLVHDLFPDQKVLAEAAVTIQESPEVEQRYGADVGKNRWDDVIANVTQHQDQFPVLAGNLKRLFGGGENWPEKAMLVGYEGGVNPERILPAVILMKIPAGWRGLFLVALVAAAMSTFSPTVNVCVALFTRDIWQGFLRPRASTRELIASSYCFGVVLVLGGFAMAYTSESINDIWDWIIMALTAGYVIPGLLRLYWWRFNAGGSNIGVAVGLIVAIGQRALKPDMPPVDKFVLVTGLSLVGTIIGTYCFPPTEKRILEHFYRTTRPFGLWGPLKASLAPQVRTTMEREHFYDIAALPFALGWQVTLFLLPMQLLIGAWRSFGVTLLVFLVCLLGVHFLWYRQLPPARSRKEEVGDGSPTQPPSELTAETA
ncbi:MAG TPA: sodium:solute symporter [Phycisphaerae bacterium]|nr:sodium:solute symporter [Phycisphaerae bacterium]HRY66482.1 sodium:solute symporter [Phycisphaerae bacterium]HSA25810.1 sodium:solute symporter [Phycisphaerae bacterium]